MKCSPKTMLKIGLVLVVMLGGGFLAFPQFRPVIIGLAPFALFALCPISMMFAMWAMDKGQHNKHSGCAACGQSQSLNQHAEKHNHGTI